MFWAYSDIYCIRGIYLLSSTGVRGVCGVWGICYYFVYFISRRLCLELEFTDFVYSGTLYFMGEMFLIDAILKGLGYSITICGKGMLPLDAISSDD